MPYSDETTALVALLAPDQGRARADGLASRVRRAGSAVVVLAEEHGLLANEAAERGRAELAAWTAQGIEAVSIFDPRFPASLRGVAGVPPVLFVAGDASLIDPGRSVAIVGSRQASRGGCARTVAIAEALVAAKFIVTSGLAEGIDTAAHEAVLAVEGTTVAVLGNGLRHVYPRANAGLQRRIARSGAVVSPFWPDSAPARWTFPQRNVLMSALSCATVIVEAGPTSGTRVQARAALDQGRLLVLCEAVLQHTWAQDLAERPGVALARTYHDVTAALRSPPLLQVA